MGRSFHVRRDVAAIGVFVVAAIVGGMWYTRSPSMTSDADLRKRFVERRALFDSLAMMAVADTQLVGLGPSMVFVKSTATQNHRLTEQEERATGRSGLRPLLQRTGLPALSRGRDGGAIWFVVESNNDIRKGYVYSRKPVVPILGSLDGARQYGYVALAPGWFIFLQSAD